MRIREIIFFIPVFLLIAGCGNQTQDTENAAATDSIAAAGGENSARPEGARYGIKSGIIRMKSTAMMMNQYITIWFDDWGRKQRNDITMEQFGKKVHSDVITDSTSICSFDMITKKGTRGTVDRGSSDNINFTELTEEIRKKFNIKEEGQEVVAGKNCRVYSFTDTEKNIKGKFSIWKGIALKSLTSVSMITVKMEAVEITENAAIPQDQFSVPPDVEIREADYKLDNMVN